MLLGEVVDELGTTDDFIGHAGGDNFIVITTEACAPPIRTRLKERFKTEIQTQYNFMDREQGYLAGVNPDGTSAQHPLMTLAIGVVGPNQEQFSDIREITELAAEARRHASA
jgi:GGDEF domain-containing protein